MINALINGEIVQLEVPYPPHVPSRIIASSDFLALWTPAQVQSVSAADAELFYGMLKVATQRTVNLDSPELVKLLALAVSKGSLSQPEATRIAAGTPPG